MEGKEETSKTNGNKWSDDSKLEDIIKKNDNSGKESYIDEDIKLKINLEPSKYLFDREMQKKVFGELYKEGLKIPFQNGQPTPIFTGLFKEYEKFIQSNKQYIILLGASGTSKTFILQQEAQKCYMIYILCNNGQNNNGERDASFTQLCSYLSTMESLKEDKKLILIECFKFINE